MKVSTPNVFLPENGEHTAVLTSVEDLGEQDSRYGRRHTSKLIFTLDDSGGEQWWYMKPTLHPASNFYKVVAALLNAIPPKEIDSDVLIGRRCILVTEQYTNQDGQPRSGVKEIRPANGAPPPRQYNQPPRQQAPPPQQAAPPPPSSQRYSTPEYHRQQQSNYRPPSGPITDEDIPF